MKYKAGQWLFLNCPEVSPYQWHPFTITSCPFDLYISVHVRQVGDFTQALGNAVGAGPQQAKMYEELDPNGIYEVAIEQDQKLPCLRIDGLYGAPAEDITKHQVAVIIGAGIGVTPWAANLEQIWNMRRTKSDCRLRRLEFVWLCRDISSSEWFRQLLLSLEAQDIGGSFLNIHIYLTQQMDSDAAANIMLNTAGRGEDAITKLRSGTQFGRPDFGKIFVSMREQISNGTYAPGLEVETRTTVGVYFCGPGGLARSIRTTCKEASDAFVLYKFWKEHF
ncbi:Respiratory burst oxidase-like protein A [Colletotrichum gloeosporioides]|uniref:Respiratory burst oxidase-like protein A n=1 Tax=Colletotrichum gloeosporioides TaxID=474922 RepID=A0A8H4CPX6_COLGL|nr:Respiratory burst oxidase-like protein A [Colletotrichum gloeosporioides]KAF3807971.1 Respiratory burst oxidase-like protein A [Colletotrichum gloeosporioides]